MKKILIAIIVIGALVIWNGEKRKFYSVGDNKYITVWKTFGGVCYIIPEKYYGLVRPSVNFMETTDDNYIVLFFSKETPSHVIYWENRQNRELKIVNNSKDKVLFVNYLSNQDSLDKLLYKPDAKKVRDVKDNVEMLDIDIEQDYATDKTGKKI
jgi:hypothetical protein